MQYISVIFAAKFAKTSTTIRLCSSDQLTVPKSPKRMTEIYRNVSYRSFHFAIFYASVSCFLLAFLDVYSQSCRTAQALSIDCTTDSRT